MTHIGKPIRSHFPIPTLIYTTLHCDILGHSLSTLNHDKSGLLQHTFHDCTPPFHGPHFSVTTQGFNFPHRTFISPNMPLSTLHCHTKSSSLLTNQWASSVYSFPCPSLTHTWLPLSHHCHTTSLPLPKLLCHNFGVVNVYNQL